MLIHFQTINGQWIIHRSIDLSKMCFFFQPPADIEEEWGIIFKDKML